MKIKRSITYNVRVLGEEADKNSNCGEFALIKKSTKQTLN